MIRRSCLLVFALLVLLSPFSQAQTPALFTNATPTQLRGIETGLEALSRLVESRDAATLKQLGIEAENGRTSNLNLALRPRLVAASVSPTGALARVNYAVWSAPDTRSTPQVVRDGTLDVWLVRTPGVALPAPPAAGQRPAADETNAIGETFSLTNKRWLAPTDAVEAMAAAADEEWGYSFASPAQSTVENRTTPDAKSGELLHLIAERRGGRWIALRRSRWDGNIYDTPNLARAAREMPGSSFPSGATQTASTGRDIRPWLRRQMARFRDEGTGVAHFLLQKGPGGWVGLDAVWDTNTKIAIADEKAAVKWRAAMEGPLFLQATAQRDFSYALARIGLFAEAADTAEKAETLQPGIIGAGRLREYAANRIRDPQALAVLQVQNESRIGIGFDHPVYVLNALAKQQGAQPTALGALQIGLEYSKLAQDERAAAWLKYAERLIAAGALKSASSNDAQWAGILHEQLAERRKYAMYKPPNIIRSGLFTVRSWPNDLNTVQLLAGLEAAQHTVYADFSVPMGNSEVVLWRNQSEFQSYTGRVSGTATSEFIAALTLTRLVASQTGPVVLGEEINVFADPRANTVSTIAHEYGHVAVRHVSSGRTVPMWFNEGIAASVEGGYDQYIPRVRAAAQRGTLLSMKELLEWDVDGERAFLAYSQANSMIDFIAARWGRESIMEILRQIGRDVPPETAFRSVLKTSSQELWNRWLREGIA
ncbi:MAG TPA: hypothetical protein VF719_08100 [Abditibacteriaceae bacterium]|jgi:hypothetical protein